MLLASAAANQTETAGAGAGLQMQGCLTCQRSDARLKGASVARGLSNTRATPTIVSDDGLSLHLLQPSAPLPPTGSSPDLQAWPLPRPVKRRQVLHGFQQVPIDVYGPRYAPVFPPSANAFGIDLPPEANSAWNRSNFDPTFGAWVSRMVTLSESVNWGFGSRAAGKHGANTTCMDDVTELSESNREVCNLAMKRLSRAWSIALAANRIFATTAWGCVTRCFPFVLPFLVCIVLLVSCVSSIVLKSIGPPCHRRRRKPISPLNRLKIEVIGLVQRALGWLAIPAFIIAFPFYVVWRALRLVDRLAFAFGLLLYGITIIFYAFGRRAVLCSFEFVMSWTCWVFAMPYHYDGIDDAFMMSSTDNDWDARKYPKCKPFFGKRGVDFDNFVRDFGAALAGEGDDDASLEETMLGMDPGGDAAGAPAALGGAAAARRRAKRGRDLYSLIYRHVPEPRLREMMHATARNDGRAAFRLLETNCRQAIDDLELLQMDADWNSATILNAVGFSVDSITLFARHLNGLNALRPVANRKTEDQSTTKFLSCIESRIEATLGHEAKKELRATGCTRQFVNAATNARDFQACVTFFDDMWRSHFRSGSIAPRPRQVNMGDRSARADAANVANDYDNEDAAFVAGGIGRRPAIDRAKMSTESNCWNCRGFGHMAEACPSEKGFRAISDAALLLSNMLPGRGLGKGTRGAARGGFPSGRGRGRGFRPMRRFGNARVTLDDGLVFDDDGNIYSTDGAYVGTVDAPADAKPPPQPTEPPAEEPATAAVAEDVENEEYVGDMYVAADVPLVETAPSSLLPCKCHGSGGLGRILRCIACAGDRFECAYCRKWKCLDIGCGVCGQERMSASSGSVQDSCSDLGSVSSDDCDSLDLFDDTASDFSKSEPGNVTTRRPLDAAWLRAMEAGIAAKEARSALVGTAVPTSQPCNSAFLVMLTFFFAAVMSIARGSVIALGKFARFSIFFLKFFLTIACGMLLGLHRGLGFGLALGAGLVQLPGGAAFAMQPVPFDNCFCVGSIKSTKADWIVDCGATKHCTPQLSDLAQVTDPNPRRAIRVGNGKLLPVTAIGTVKLNVPTCYQTKRKNKTNTVHGHELMELSNVLVVPEMTCRLMSSEWAWRHDGIGTYLNNDRYLRLPNGSHVPFKPAEADGHYRIAKAFAASDLTMTDSELWHASLAHFSPGRIDLAKHHGNSTLFGYRHDPTKCSACLANRRKKSIPNKSASGTVYTHFGEMVCSDICGPFPESPHGFKWACNFYDKFSHHASVYFMKEKNGEEIKRCHMTWLSDHKEYLKDGKMGTWMTDDGVNFHTASLDQLCVDLATRRAFAVPHVKEKHGAAERLWGILLGPASKMAFHAGNDTGKEGLWPFLLTHVCQVHNALPTASLSPPASPHELATGKKFDLSIFKGKVPLSDCWVNTANPDDKPVNKLGPNNIKAVYLCHDMRRRGDFVYLPELKRITTTWHVTHCPREFTLLGEPVTVRRADVRGGLPSSASAPGGTIASPPLQQPMPIARDLHGNPAVPPPAVIADADVANYSSHADAFMTKCGINCCVVSPSAVGPVRIPTGYWDAINDPVYGEKWKEACNEEHGGKFLQNQSWVYVHKPGNRTLTKSKWVFKVEYNQDGSIKRFKPRIVACGYSQIEGLDWTEKYASTLSSDSMRTFLFDAVQCSNDICEADVVKAFTHATIEEEIYMAPPEGYAPPDGKVCLLKKGVEGLKQGANGFMKLNASVIEAEQMARSMLDPNVFTRTRNAVTLKVGNYVDNILVSFPPSVEGRKQCAEFFKAYSKKIKLEIRGRPKAFMGVQIEYDINKGTLFLHQSKYMEQAFEKFCDKSTKIYTTPVQTSACEVFTNLRTAENDAERMQMSDKNYLSLMGCILWPVVMTRPDCAYYASFLCQFMSDPTIECWYAAIALLSYMYGTRKLGLMYRRMSKMNLSLYCDSSYNSSPKPMFGYVVFANGTPVSWTAKKQKIVPQSSCEAETAALCAGCKNLVFIYNLLHELGTSVQLPMDTHTDNDAARLSAINPGTTARTKHYEIWMRYCRELYLKLMITINWVPTKEQIADLFTKPLDKTTFLYLRSLLMSEQR